MDNVMLDLETLGVGSNSVILSIGAVRFDLDFGVTDEFYEAISLQDSIDKKFDIDADTLKWWLSQEISTRHGALSGNNKVKDVLISFLDWLKPNEHLQLWGNGAAFDNILLKNAYMRFKIRKPWLYYSDRCYRTILNSYDCNYEPVGNYTAHNAVSDAKYQALKLIHIANTYKIKGML